MCPRWKIVSQITLAMKLLPGKHFWGHQQHPVSFIISPYRYVFSAPGKLLDSIPGTLMLTDCLDSCTNNDSCSSVNYETGLCVLFSSNADKLPGKSSSLLILALSQAQKVFSYAYFLNVNFVCKQLWYHLHMYCKAINIKTPDILILTRVQ